MRQRRPPGSVNFSIAFSAKCGPAQALAPKVSQLNRKTAAQVRKAATDPSKGRCTCGSDPTNRHCWWPRRVDRGHRTRRHRNRVGGRTRDNSRICGSTRAGGCRNCRTRRDTRICRRDWCGTSDRCRRYTYLPPGLVWNLATLPPRYLPPRIGVELGHAAAEIFAARIGVDASRFGHGYRADQHEACRGADRDRTPHQISTHCSPPR